MHHRSRPSPRAVRRALASAGLPDAEPTFERPRNPEHGDWATNVALTLAKHAGRPPREIAQAIAGQLDGVEGIVSVEVAGPGFLNFRLAADALGAVVRQVVAAGDDWGRTAPRGSAGRANVEFISVNPTGPLHVGHGRWVAGGDAIARLLEATGWEVTREYYLNDAGTQVDLFGASVAAAQRGDGAARGRLQGRLHRRAGRPSPRRGGHRRRGHPRARPRADDRGDPHHAGAPRRPHRRLVQRAHASTPRAALPTTVQSLRDRGEAYEADGATWLATTRYGDDKDRVLIRSDRRAHLLRRRRRLHGRQGRPRLRPGLYLLGADHHGYVNRLHAIARAEGIPDGTIEIIIGQLVNLTRDGVPVRMGKRSGNYVTLDELLDEVGPDAARYTFVRTSTDQTLEFDLAKVVREERDNPVHYVNYSYARIAGILRKAEAAGVDVADVNEARLGPARRRVGARAPPHDQRLPREGGVRRRAPRAPHDRPLRRGPRGALPPLLRALPGHPGRARTWPAPATGCASPPSAPSLPRSTSWASRRASGCSPSRAHPRPPPPSHRAQRRHALHRRQRVEVLQERRPDLPGDARRDRGRASHGRLRHLRLLDRRHRVAVRGRCWPARRAKGVRVRMLLDAVGAPSR